MLTWTGIEFIPRPVDADEHPYAGESPAEYVMRLAAAKARMAVNGKEREAISAADTTVADGNLILGKPVDPEEARQMLRRLRGRSHQVFTALTVYLPGSGWFHDLCQSQVPMRKYTEDEIKAYIATGDPMDKAGGYAIQNAAFHPVTGFSGCFANVMGLPLCHFTRTLRKGGQEPAENVPESCQRHLAYACPIYQAVLTGRDIG
jgi:septum formation protein